MVLAWPVLTWLEPAWLELAWLELAWLELTGSVVRDATDEVGRGELVSVTL